MDILFSLIILLFSATIHEYMHAWTANELGDSTAKNAGRLTINPLVHIDPWGSILLPALLYFSTNGLFVIGYAKPVPYNPFNLRNPKYDGVKVAIAGPIANLVMAIFCGLVIRFLPMESPMFFEFMQKAILINLVLMIFNMVPLPPLDGSKVLMPFLPKEAQKIYYYLEMHPFYNLVILLFLINFPPFWMFFANIINIFYNLLVGTSFIVG